MDARGSSSQGSCRSGQVGIMRCGGNEEKEKGGPNAPRPWGGALTSMVTKLTDEAPEARYSWRMYWIVPRPCTRGAPLIRMVPLGSSAISAMAIGCAQCFGDFGKEEYFQGLLKKIEATFENKRNLVG